MVLSDFIYIPLCIFLALQFPRLLLKGKEYKFYPVLKYLAFFHFLIAYGYYKITNNWAGDAYSYWFFPRYIMTTEDALSYFTDGEGTLFVRGLNYIPAKILEMSFLANTFLFAMFGFFGLVFFFVTILRLIPHNKKIYGIQVFPWIFFLPNLHFWSVGVGKDSLLFLCIGMFVFGLLKPMKNLPLLIFSGLLALAVRPHMVLFMVAGLGLGYVFGGKISGLKRFFYASVLITASVLILPKVLEFTRVEDTSLESFDSFSQKKSQLLSRGHTGSAVDMSSYPFPLKMATFWFRPLFFDARNVTGLMASAENLILLTLFIMAMRASPIRAWRKAPFLVKGLFFYMVLGSFAFSQSMGNLGIMIRMRNMFLPAMIIFLLWVFSYEKEGQLERIRRIKAIRKRRAQQKLKEASEAVQ